MMTPIIKLVIVVTVINFSESRRLSFHNPLASDEELDRRTYKREGVGPQKDLDSNGRFVGDFNSDCSESLFVTPSHKTVNIQPDDEILSQAGTKCHWNVIGTETCHPLLSCKKFKLAPTAAGAAPEDKCKEEYLEVTDGSGGYDKFCGNEGPQDATALKNLRDIYITYKAGPGTNKRGLKCTVTCTLKEGEGKPLPSAIEANVVDTCNCGRKPNGDRIVGGEDAKRGEFPWIAGLVTAHTRKPFCGGTIINDRFILTAAHCFKGPYMKKDNLQVLLNGHLMDLTSSAVASGQGGSEKGNDDAIAGDDKKQNSVRFSVEKYFIHPLYVRQTNDYDVALIKTDKPIDFVKYNFLMPACMPDTASYNTLYEGKAATVAGWGLNSSDATQTMGTLQKLDIKVFTLAECKSFFDERLTRRMLCAGYKEGGKDSCKGDSGGPLISEKKTQLWEIIGAVSWGESCAGKNSPGVYLRIAEVEQWIRYMANNEDAVWCTV